MNVNCRISLTDEERNILYRRMTGKDVKRMASRKEVCELVQGFIQTMIADAKADWFREWGKEFDSDAADAAVSAGHEQCCVQNQLLLNRVNQLQRKLDKMVAK